MRPLNNTLKMGMRHCNLLKSLIPKFKFWHFSKVSYIFEKEEKLRLVGYEKGKAITY